MFMNKWARLCFLILGGGTIFKLSSMKDVFYVPMQSDWGLTNTQIGLSFTVIRLFRQPGFFCRSISQTVIPRKYYYHLV